jgi:hypothetical protein
MGTSLCFTESHGFLWYAVFSGTLRNKSRKPNKNKSVADDSAPLRHLQMEKAPERVL